MMMRSFLFSCLLVVSVGCSEGEKLATRVQKESKVEPLNRDRVDAAMVTAALDASVVATSGDASVHELGWTRFKRSDATPLCLFTSYEQWWHTQFLKDVKKSIPLREGRELFFGAYAPGCASLECIREPSIQCWLEVEGQTITVHTLYSGHQRDPTACGEKCESVTAECRTGPLAAGTYTLRYGAMTQTLRVPSVVRPTCIAPPGS